MSHPSTRTPSIQSSRAEHTKYSHKGRTAESSSTGAARTPERHNSQELRRAVKGGLLNGEQKSCRFLIDPFYFRIDHEF